MASGGALLGRLEEAGFSQEFGFRVLVLDESSCLTRLALPDLFRRRFFLKNSLMQDVVFLLVLGSLFQKQFLKRWCDVQ